MSHTPHHEPTTSLEYHETLHEHDEWFRHAADEPAHQQAHGRTSAGIIIAFLMGTVVFVGVTGLLVFEFFLEATAAQVVVSQEGQTPIAQLLAARADWDRQHSQLSLIEGAPGRAHIPLNLAYELVIKDYARNGGK